MPKAVSSLPKIERKKSRLHGFGVFALETINKNKRIIDYAGELISNKQSEAREDRYLAKGCIWVFRVNRTGVATPPSAATSRASSIIPAVRTAGSKSTPRPGRSGCAPPSRFARARS
jgi:hypothetical protein